MSESSASSPCPSADRLAQFVDGELCEDDADALARHVSGCPNCRWLCSATHASGSGALLSADAVWAASLEPLPIGTRLGRYRIDAELGRGGMGIVYAAFDERLGRDVAIKCVHAPMALDRRDRMERLRAEAKTLAAAATDQVVEIFDIGEADDQVFVVMQRVDGEPLRRWCAGRPTLEVVSMLGALARAIEGLHAQGWVHGDIKPDNVMVDVAGEIRLLDFGLSRALHAEGPGLPSAAGTPAYMAPEQLAGAPAGPGSDQYAWGVTAFEMLTGDRPHHASTLGELRAQVERAAVSWPTEARVPRTVQRVVERTLVSSAARFPTMGHVEAGLTRRRRDGLLPALAVPALAAAILLVPTSEDPACLQALDPVETGESVFDADAAAWSARWSDAAAQACERLAEAPLLGACLQDLRRSFTAISPVDGTPSEADRIALVRLPSPDTCLGPQTSTTRAPVQDDPALATALEDLARLRVALQRGRTTALVAESQELEARLAQLGARRAMAELLLLRGRAQTREHAFDDARASFRGANAHALTAGADDLSAKIWLAVVSLEGRYAYDRPAADRALRFAEAALERAGRPAALEAQYALVSGAYFSEHNDERASPALELAVARTLELHGEQSLQYAEALNAMGILGARAGSLEEAEQNLDASTQIYAQRLGATSQKVALLLANRATLALIRRDPPAAVSLGTRALSLLPARAKARAKVEATIGDALSLDGRFPEALPHHREALELREADLPGNHPGVITSRIALTTTLRRIGDAQSLAEANEVVGRARAYAAEHDLARMRTLLNLEQGRIDQALGKTESAARYCQLALDEAEDPRDVEHARDCVAETTGS